MFIGINGRPFEQNFPRSCPVIFALAGADDARNHPPNANPIMSSAMAFFSHWALSSSRPTSTSIAVWTHCSIAQMALWCTENGEHGVGAAVTLPIIANSSLILTTTCPGAARRRGGEIAYIVVVGDGR